MEPIRRTASTPANGGSAGPKHSPPFKKSTFSDFNSVLRRSYSITIEEESILEDEAATMDKNFKMINDNIHGHMTFPTVAMLIVDTPQFQRLRNIKQLGNNHFVFPGATHSRFQHSLGVGHLAAKFALALRDQKPDLVDQKDVDCVMIAGLCHDLGHGPWSHFWEGYIKFVNKGEDMHHEDLSIQMLDRLLDVNNLRPKLLAYGIDETDILFIKELIAGPIDPETGLPSRKPQGDNTWPYRGRSEVKGFLYEIVANKENGIDVDKWDYFLRDDQALKIGITFKYERFIACARLMRHDPSSQDRHRICIRDKEADNIREMFIDRARLHRHGYQHRVTKTIDVMLMDALKEADSCISVKGSDGKMYPPSQCHKDIVAYEKLTDSVFQKILECDSEEAISIVNKILTRNLYKMLAEIRLPVDAQVLKKSNADICSEIQHLMRQGSEVNGTGPSCDSIFVIRRHVSFGRDSENPRKGKVPFYTRSLSGEVTLSQPILVDFKLPDEYLDRTLWVCSRTSDKSFNKRAVGAVQKWKEANRLDVDFQN